MHQNTSLTEDPVAEAQAELSDDAASSASDDEALSDEDDDFDSDDEAKVAKTKTATGGGGVGGVGGSAGAYFLKPLLIQAIQDLIDELETVDDNISKVHGITFTPEKLF